MNIKFFQTNIELVNWKMYIASQEIGEPIPNNTEHAVSVTLPTWESIVGYEEGDPAVVDLMKTGYPRFFIHKSIQELNKFFLERYCRKEIEDVFVFPSYKISQECREFMKHRIEVCCGDNKKTIGDDSTGETITNDYNNLNKKIRIVNLVTKGPKTELEKSFKKQVSFGIVVFPKEYYKFAKEFWQHAGEGISSRLAEYLLYEYKYSRITNDDNVGIKKNIEEKFGRNLDFENSEEANLIIRKRLNNQIIENHLSATTNKHKKFSENDIYLYPSGMSSIYNSHKIWRKTIDNSENKKTVVFGFPYVDTLNIANKFGAGLIHLGHGSDTELDQLKNDLQAGKYEILGVIVECPGNPLLKTPNLIKLRQISNELGFPVTIDDTVGNLINLNIYQYCDMSVSSLTKIFSGDSNVLAGVLILNNESRYYCKFKEYLNTNFENNFWVEDCIYLERNSRDIKNRNLKTNQNAEKILELFEKYQKMGLIEKIYYPKVSNVDLFDKFKNANSKFAGYGGLISVLMKDLETSKKFYNSLAISKGPSLGTNFTLACPYAVLVHYNELNHVKQFGIHENLIRISIGIEPTDELVKTFEDALLSCM